MKIILEGPDNAGKTTLATKLHELCPDMLYHHPGGRPKNFEDEVICMQEQTSILLRPGAKLLDRCTAISQRVYSTDVEKDLVRRQWLQDALVNGVTFIYCRPNTDWLMSFEHFTWREGETEEFKQEIISKQHVYIDRYDRIMQTLPHVHYDYKSDTAEAIIKHLAFAIDGNQTSITLINSLKTFEVPKCV